MRYYRHIARFYLPVMKTGYHLTLSVTYDGAGPVPALADEKIPGIPEMRRLVAMRRSVRAYKDNPVPRETLQEILDTARYAPTGMNGQSVSWIVSLKIQRRCRALSGRLLTGHEILLSEYRTIR